MDGKIRSNYTNDNRNISHSPVRMEQQNLGAKSILRITCKWLHFPIDRLLGVNVTIYASLIHSVVGPNVRKHKTVLGGSVDGIFPTGMLKLCKYYAYFLCILGVF